MDPVTVRLASCPECGQIVPTSALLRPAWVKDRIGIPYRKVCPECVDKPPTSPRYRMYI